MPNIEEIYDNVEVFISNLEILLTKNIFKGKFQQEVKTLGTELYKLCKVKQFKIDSSEILSMPSFVDLFYHTPKKSQGLRDYISHKRIHRAFGQECHLNQTCRDNRIRV